MATTTAGTARPRRTSRAKAPAADQGATTPDAPTETLLDEIEQTAKKTTTRGRSVSPTFIALGDTKEFLRILMYGREGSAKTTNALLASKRGKTLVINAEAGIKKRPLIQNGVVAENVVVWPPEGPVTHRRLDRLFRSIKADLDQDPDSWFCIVFDSATIVVEGMVEQVADDRIDKTRNMGTEIDEFDRWVTDRNDYGTMAKMFRDVLRKYRTLPVHLVITALERRDVDEDTGRATYGPAVSPALQTDLLGYLDIVLYCKAEDEDEPFRAATRKGRNFRAKDRFKVLPPVLAVPTFERILQYVEGDLTPETDPLQALLPQRQPRVAKTRKGKKSKTSVASAAERTETEDED